MSQTTMKEPQVTVELAKELGLLPEEFEQIKLNLGRTPNFTELSIYSVMWSEHCSYKNSILWLKTLPREGELMLVEAGKENAGLIDLGNGKACAFKIESHNHPSAVEPYQGAATGVGGINRDIFTMGARPIAQLNSLRFGNLGVARVRQLLAGVVRGIGDYGNSFGVPTVAGETYFEDCYEHNPLVNAMSVGIMEAKDLVSATSEGVGNPVFIVGSATGKDGIHGATFASDDISEDAEEDLPSVQVGDPFQEKLLLEASLEVIKTDQVVGMQDMGAAGITCSTSEMSEKGGCGMKIWLDKVPTRQEGMVPFEILLSESQERMLIVVKKGGEQAVIDVFDKWDLNCVQIGEVTEGNELEYYFHDELIAQVPADTLVLGGGAPVYEREYAKPEYQERIQAFQQNSISTPSNIKVVAKQLAKHPNIASKRWISEQYDSMVGIVNRTTNRPSDAAIIRYDDSDKALAVTVDCNARYVYADPKAGTAMAVSECARNIVCSGGKPAAVTNCLNFGNPYKPGVYWQFVNAIQGMGEACRQFDTPVTGGNVSFYNQSHTGIAVYPTPTIGMVGIMDDVKHQMTLDFKSEGDHIILLGEEAECIHSSQYLKTIHGVEESPAPNFDLKKEAKLQDTVYNLIRSGLVKSAHDTSDGGLFFTLLEKAYPSDLGFNLDSKSDIRVDAELFGEAQSRIVISVSADQLAKLESEIDIPMRKLGTVTSGKVSVHGENWGNIQDWKNMYEKALPEIMK